MVGGYVGFDFFAESLSSFAKKDWEDCCRFREAEPWKKQKHLITQHAWRSKPKVCLLFKIAIKTNASF